jgi:hypothetical protein
MTDRERWMKGNDPAWMLAAMGEQADERRCEIAVRYMRDAFRTRHGIAYEPWSDSRNWREALKHAWCEPPLCGIIRCLWPSPSIERERDICEQCEGKKTVETIVRYYGWDEKRRGATYEDGECWECRGSGSILIPLINPRWRTPLVLNLARQVRGWYYEETAGGDRFCVSGEPNPDLSPILSDALQDAGCDVPEVIEHLKCGVHVAGECWVMRELLGDMK